ncbi:hypothetical protein DOY81_012372 [Sarcophaga bullata]|nr:hypothetical protein DOY81_012372 [Sarcophaga bullata]
MPPASGSNNNTSNAAVQAAAKAEREEKLRGALKSFILKERQRKKEEYEAKLEEDRLRKEREARERQNDMTLEETRTQITKMEKKLEDLHNQKQQLVLQLKKVLNEDENRKKQQKDNEMYAMQALQAQQATAPQPPVFVPPVRVQHHPMHILTKPPNNAPVKRGRSPSPTQQAYYKTANYSQPKHEEIRRGADSARVLWNKPHTQYQTPGTLFYQTTSNAPPPQPPPDARAPAIIYAHYNLPLRQGYHLELPPSSSVPVSKPDVTGQKPTQVYHINLDQPPISQAGGSSVSNVQSQKPQITMEKISERYHVEVKHDGPPTHGGPPPHQLPESVVYTPLIPNMPLHPNVMQISGGPQQNPKPGTSISQGYAPSRSSGHDQQQLSRQQITVLPGQPGQQPQQPLHYNRRMF